MYILAFDLFQKDNNKFIFKAKYLITIWICTSEIFEHSLNTVFETPKTLNLCVQVEKSQRLLCC